MARNQGWPYVTIPISLANPGMSVHSMGANCQEIWILNIPVPPILLSSDLLLNQHNDPSLLEICPVIRGR
jgi:hypothetical protein